MTMAEYIERVPSCRDCFHYDACFYHISEETKTLTANECPLFVKKTDVVEVVRCKDCIHRDKKGVCEKFRQRYPFFPEDDFYCGYCAKMDGKGEG